MAVEELPKKNGVFIQMEDEIAGIASVNRRIVDRRPCNDCDERPRFLPDDGEYRVRCNDSEFPA